MMPALHRLPHFPLFRLAVLLWVPVSLFLLVTFEHRLVGPHFQGALQDPDYAYLLNALNVAQLRQVGHSDHPGSTVQLLGGAVLRLHQILFFWKGDLKSQVMADPEYFLHLIQFVLSGLCCLSLGYAGIRLARFSLPLAVLFQVGTIGLYGFSSTLLRVTPEPFLLTIVILLSASLLEPVLSGKPAAESDALWWGILAGMGVATKVTFLPVLILPFILLSGVWRRELYVAVTGLTVAALVMNPLMNLERTFRFLGELAQRKGYNRPPVEGASLSEHFGLGMQSLSNELTRGTLSCFAVAVLILAVYWLITLLGRERGAHVLWLKLAGGILLLVMGQFALVAVSPRAEVRYLLPCLALSGAVLVLVGVAMNRKPWLVWSFVTVATFGFFGLAQSSLRESRRMGEDYAALSRTLERYEHLPKVGLYLSSLEPYALTFGNIFSRQTTQVTVAQQFPEFLNYDIWAGRYADVLGRPVDLPKVLAHYPQGILLVGKPLPAGIPGVPDEIYRQLGLPKQGAPLEGVEARVTFREGGHVGILLQASGGKIGMRE